MTMVYMVLEYIIIGLIMIKICLHVQQRFLEIARMVLLSTFLCGIIAYGREVGVMLMAMIGLLSADNPSDKKKGVKILIPYILGREPDWENHYNYCRTHFLSSNYEKKTINPFFVSTDILKRLEKCVLIGIL